MTFLSAVKPRQFLVSCAIGLGAIAPATRAVAQQVTVVADIPFSFHDNVRTYPAGKYFIKETADHMILIRNTLTDQLGLVMSLDQNREVTRDRGQLIFHKYGDQYFLRDIWLADSRIGRQLVMGKTEKVLRGNAARRPAPDNQIALNVTKP